MKKPIIITAVALFVATGLIFAVWQMRNGSNLASAESPFNSITLPIKRLKGQVWMDGGSVNVGVEDNKGNSYYFIFPYDYNTKGYPTAFHSASMPTKVIPADAVPLIDPVRAREIILTWLRQDDSRDEGLDSALEYLSRDDHSILRRFQLDGIRGIFK